MFYVRLVYQKVLHCAKHETKINLRFLKTLMNHFQNQFSIPFTNRSLNINIKNNFYNFISNVKINKIVSIFLIIDLNFFNFQTDNRFYFQLWPWLRGNSLFSLSFCKLHRHPKIKNKKKKKSGMKLKIFKGHYNNNKKGKNKINEE